MAKVPINAVTGKVVLHMSADPTYEKLTELSARIGEI
jgi:hypothetical protein